MSNRTDGTRGAAPSQSAESVNYLIDAPLGLAVGVLRIAGRATNASVAVVRPIVRSALRPPLLPHRFWPQSTIERWAHRGAIARHDAERKASALADTLVPAVVDALLGRTDLAGIAHKVIDDIDLPEIIRESSGTMASESVIGVRLQGIYADDKVNRIIDRLLLRRSERNTAPDADTPNP
ncbi:hypothetical protein ACFQZZ_21460 [Nocardia sp. GCM10030253]|uniref:hypothetical protein n=1 Tax=Nocardia sp. GCM10030253 TaxID=3273404 RepID=UPI003625DB03